MSMIEDVSLEVRKASRRLAYAGALPFVFVALVAVTGRYDVPPFDAREALLVYSAVILSFLAGIHWQIGITSGDAPRNLLILTNVVALAAW